MGRVVELKDGCAKACLLDVCVSNTTDDVDFIWVDLLEHFWCIRREIQQLIHLLFEYFTIANLVFADTPSQQWDNLPSG